MSLILSSILGHINLGRRMLKSGMCLLLLQEAALFVVNTRSKEEAMSIFTEVTDQLRARESCVYVALLNRAIVICQLARAFSSSFFFFLVE